MPEPVRLEIRLVDETAGTVPTIPSAARPAATLPEVPTAEQARYLQRQEQLASFLPDFKPLPAKPVEQQPPPAPQPSFLPPPDPQPSQPAPWQQTHRPSPGALPPPIPPSALPPVQAQVVYPLPPVPPPVWKLPEPPASFWQRVSAELSQTARTAIAPTVSAGLTKATGSATIGALAGTGAAELTASAGPAGIAIGAVILATTALVESFKGLKGAVDEAARKLSQLSPVVARATAREEVALLRAQLASAQRIGPRLAGYMQERTRTEVLLEEIHTELLRSFLPAMTAILRELRPLLQGIADAGNQTNEILDWFRNHPRIRAGAVLLGNLLAPVQGLIFKYLTEPADKDREFTDAELDAFFNPVTTERALHGRKDLAPVPREAGGGLF